MKKIITSLLFITLLSIGFLSAQTPRTNQLSTHILDINLGKPASGVTITLYKMNLDTREFEFVDADHTDPNGRVGSFLPYETENYGVYKLRFNTATYFESQGIKSIYPYVEVTFVIEGEEHYHIPITVSANGYSTYRGS